MPSPFPGPPEQGHIIDTDLRGAADSLAASLTSPATTRAGHRQSLSRGAAGIALLHIERAAQDLASWDTAHAWLTAATSGGVHAGHQAAPCLGAPAIAYALHGASRHRSYHRAQARLDHAVAAITRQRLDQAHARIDRADRPPLREFDTINGLTGLGAHHLRHDPHGHILPDILTYLVRLTEPLTDGGDLPGWWTSQPPDARRATGPGQHGGHSNHGMAHGTGPLALLALAMRHQITVPGQTGAINRICDWLDTWQQPSLHGPWWPETLTLDDLRRGTPRQTRPARPSWCYGTPGIARAQQLAGQSLADPARQRLAETALLGCLTDPRQQALITGTGLCHGTAGLFQATWRIAAEARHTDLTSQLHHLADTLTNVPPQPGAGVLDGAAGLALAQTTAATGRVTTSWDTFLLLH